MLRLTHHPFTHHLSPSLKRACHAVALAEAGAVSSAVERLLFPGRGGGSNPSPPSFLLPVEDLGFAIEYLTKAFRRRRLRRGSLSCRGTGCRCDPRREGSTAVPCRRESLRRWS